MCRTIDHFQGKQFLIRNEENKKGITYEGSIFLEKDEYVQKNGMDRNGLLRKTRYNRKKCKEISCDKKHLTFYGLKLVFYSNNYGYNRSIYHEQNSGRNVYILQYSIVRVQWNLDTALINFSNVDKSTDKRDVDQQSE